MLAYEDGTQQEDESDNRENIELFIVKAKQQQKLEKEEPFDLLEETFDRVFSPFNNLRTNNNSLKDLMDLLITKWGEAQYTSIEGLNKGKVCNNCKEEIKKQTAELETKVESMAQEMERLANLNQQLERESGLMANKLRHSLPNHSIAFACITSFGFAGFLIIYMLQLFNGIYFIHPFITFSGMIGSGGLLVTALLSIKDWKDWLSKNE